MVLTCLVMLLQSGPRQLPAILIRRIVGFKGDGQRVTAAAYSPTARGDTEVLSRRTFPGQGEVQEVVRVAPEGKTSAAGHMGEQTPMKTSDGGHVQFGPQPDTDPETYTAPESGEQPPSEKEVCLSRRCLCPTRGTG